jgi:hypothetical protein
MNEKKMITYISPDLRKLQAVFIDGRTTIYIDKDADPNDAKRLYEERRKLLNLKFK